jgi:hypothetical protein
MVTHGLVLAQFNESGAPDEPGIERAVTIATVTAGEDGSASFDARVPTSLPGGYYAVVAIREGRNLTDPGPLGAYDVGYTYVRALETDIRVESREDANNQAFQPGEAVPPSGPPPTPRSSFPTLSLRPVFLLRLLHAYTSKLLASPSRSIQRLGPKMMIAGATGPHSDPAAAISASSGTFRSRASSLKSAFMRSQSAAANLPSAVASRKT